MVYVHWLVPQGLIVVLFGSALGGYAFFVVTSHGVDLYALRGCAMWVFKWFVLVCVHFVTVVSYVMRDVVMQLGT